MKELALSHFSLGDARAGVCLLGASLNDVSFEMKKKKGICGC